MPRANLSTPAVIAAGADFADRRGFEELTVSALARELGVRPASLYSHVRDLEALLRGVQGLAMAELGEAVTAAVEGKQGRAALAAHLDTHRDFAVAHPGRWRAVGRPVGEIGPEGPGPARLGAALEGILADYGIIGDEAVHASRFIAATLRGFLAADNITVFRYRVPTVEESWQRMVDALDRTLRVWPRSDAQAEGAARPGAPDAA